jgi:hypothetical protein
MFYQDHNPPHFHAEYGDESAIIDISTLAIIEGHLSARATGLVAEWASIHQQELSQRWEEARRHEPLEKIAPLR